MSKIDTLKRKIVETKMRLEDTSTLEKQLREAILEEQVQRVIEETDKIVDQRNMWQKQAEEIQKKVRLQDEAISRFLELRDSVVGQLEPILEPMRELSKMQSMNRDGSGEVYAQFHDAYQWGSIVKEIPKCYFPSGFGCPIVEMADGKSPAYEKAAEALWYFTAALGILQNFVKGQMPILVNQKIDDSLGSDEEDSLIRCVVCQHPEREAIDKALKEGKSLRDIETKFNVSRSSLSRHKNRCLNLGAIRTVKAEPESPTVSANQTFFRG